MSRKVFIAEKVTNKINTVGVSVGTTVGAVSTNSRKLAGGVQIVAAASNTGVVYVGVRPNLTAGTNDDSDGFPLSAGESVLLPVSAESEVYAIADAASQKLFMLSF